MTSPRKHKADSNCQRPTTRALNLNSTTLERYEPQWGVCICLCVCIYIYIYIYIYICLQAKSPPVVSLKPRLQPLWNLKNESGVHISGSKALCKRSSQRSKAFKRGKAHNPKPQIETWLISYWESSNKKQKQNPPKTRPNPPKSKKQNPPKTPDMNPIQCL